MIRLNQQCQPYPGQQTGAAGGEPAATTVLETLDLLRIGVKRARERLRAFEELYELTSDEFLRRFQAGEIGGNDEFLDWEGEFQTYRSLRSHHLALTRAFLEE